MIQLVCANEIIIITVKTIFLPLMVYITKILRSNEFEVLGEVCDVVRGTSVLKTPEKDIGRRGCTSQYMNYALIYLHPMFN